MKKIVFFDIDGTLLDHNKLLPSKTKEAIQQLKRNGVFVAIATGRAPFMYESLRNELDIDSYISFNGQYVIFEEEPIYANPLSKQELERLTSFSDKKDHPLVFFDEKTVKANRKHHPFIQKSFDTLKFNHPEEDGDFYLRREIYQSLLFCEEKDEKDYLEEFNHFTFIRWHPYSLDILPRGGSKAEGIRKMIEKLNFSIDDVYAFGDGLNDIEMLKSVGTGVVMGNAVDEVKKHADMITDDVAEDGIYNGLKKLGLI